jgi:hypothetical protein
LFTYQRHLDAILAMPAESLNWCLAYTMDGDVDFGWSRTNS